MRAGGHTQESAEDDESGALEGRIDVVSPWGKMGVGSRSLAAVLVAALTVRGCNHDYVELTTTFVSVSMAVLWRSD